jgi:hypothetical protein
MGDVFISYRGEDSAPYAGRIADRLGASFGADHVLTPAEDIAPGGNSSDAIDNTLANCETLVAIIGPDWLTSLNARPGGRDDVEHEISTALRKGLTVLPVLVAGARMPSETDLPPHLAPLARRQPIVIDDARFEDGVDRLILGIERKPVTGRDARRVVWLVIAAGILIAIVGSTLLLSSSRRKNAIDGEWIARMHHQGSVPYSIRLRLVREGRNLTGTVEFPTGTGAIEGGSIDGGRIAFFTKQRADFDTQPATINFSGEIRGREIELTATSAFGKVATGIARKTQ